MTDAKNKSNLDLRFIDIPKIENYEILQDLCVDLLLSSGKFDNVGNNGREGQSQNGIDVFARDKVGNKWIGYQCKVRSTNRSISEKDLISEIYKAKEFNPSISEFVFFTTLDRDTKTQENIRKINNNNTVNNAFLISIYFWQDIEVMLRTNIDVYLKYYRKFFRDNTSFGHSIGKLLNLRLGYDDSYDTQFQLIVGKIPDYLDRESNNVDYYRDVFYLIDLQEKTFDYFKKLDSYNSFQFRNSIKNVYDRNRIALWLNTIQNIDDLIYEDKFNYHFMITLKQHEDIINRLQNDED